MFVNGTVGNTTIAAAGTASVIVGGLQSDAQVNLAGAATVSLGVTSSKTLLTTFLPSFLSDGTHISLQQDSRGLWSVSLEGQ